MEAAVNHHFLESLLDEVHPFDNLIEGNVESTMSNYLAMSQAFPYLQSGSQKDLYSHYVENNIPIDKDFEVTSVVGNFLAWDETGGLYVTLKRKMAGIADILNTGQNFHSNHLKDDLAKIFARDVVPFYSATTKKYLNSLYENLANVSGVKRCATMVSFEIHANQMIQSLWNSISKIYLAVEKNKLRYFYEHVGGDNPAEQYHVQMTQEMINIIANTPEKQSQFIAHFKKMYRLHIQWCSDIVLCVSGTGEIAYEYARSQWPLHEMQSP